MTIKDVDVSTELNLASCYSEIGKYDEAENLITKVLERPDNAPSEYGLFVVGNIRGRIHLGRREYEQAQERFQASWERYPDDPYYTLAFLFCAAQRDVSGEKPGLFESSYRMVAARSHETERLMGYHIDALRAFVLVRRNRRDEAREAVARWKDSAAAKRYIPIFWLRFPDGSQIIDNWNAL